MLYISLWAETVASKTAKNAVFKRMNVYLTIRPPGRFQMFSLSAPAGGDFFFREQ